MSANLVGDLHGSLIGAGRLGADWEIDDFVEKGRFIGRRLRPRIWPNLDENDTDGPIFPRLLATSPLIIVANNHTRFGRRQLLAQAIT